MSTMTRVSKRQPCPVCRKTDWCLIGKSLVACMRVTSPRPKTFKDGSVGYLHPLDGSVIVIPPKKEREKVNIDCAKLLEEWAGREIPTHGVKKYAEMLGVSHQSLLVLGCQPAPYWGTFAFPMRDGNNHIVGIRLRNEEGRKWAQTGSHQGLFIPQMEYTGYLYIVEGPTDTAAAVTMGVFAIGRPSCMGGVFDLIATIKRLHIRRAVVVADTDQDKQRPDGTTFNPGVDGAERLAEQLGIPNCTLLLPSKDMRDFLKQGGTQETLNYLTNQCIWRHV